MHYVTGSTLEINFHFDHPSVTMLSVADCQTKFDEISAIRQAAKCDYSISNARKQEIAEQYSAASKELRAASAAAMAVAARPSSTAHKD
jgi:hypothetical protein